MATFKSFEEIDAWQSGRQLTNEIYSLTSHGIFARDFGLKDQIRRAAVSIISNIAEGFDRGGTTEFIQFLYIAKGSNAELRAQLYIAADLGYLTEEEFKHAAQLAEKTGKLIGGLIQYLRATDIKGPKFK